MTASFLRLVELVRSRAPTRSRQTPVQLFFFRSRRAVLARVVGRARAVRRRAVSCGTCLPSTTCDPWALVDHGPGDGVSFRASEPRHVPLYFAATAATCCSVRADRFRGRWLGVRQLEAAYVPPPPARHEHGDEAAARAIGAGDRAAAIAAARSALAVASPPSFSRPALGVAAA